MHKSAQLAYWFSLEYANGQHLPSSHPELEEKMEKEFCPLPFYRKFTTPLFSWRLKACYLHDSELSWKVCASLRTAPRWINWIRYNLRPVRSQSTISDWEKYGNLTPASMESAHRTWVVALCCQFVLWWFRSFFYVNDCAVMNVQFSLSPLWLAGRICVQLRCCTHAWSAPAAQGILHLSTHSHGCTYSVLPEDFRIELMWLNV